MLLAQFQLVECGMLPPLAVYTLAQKLFMEPAKAETLRKVMHARASEKLEGYGLSLRCVGQGLGRSLDSSLGHPEPMDHQLLMAMQVHVSRKLCVHLTKLESDVGVRHLPTHYPVAGSAVPGLPDLL